MRKKNVKVLRRFEDIARAVPEAVTPLSDDHPAVIQHRPLFRGSIRSADDGERVLISAHNNVKIGQTIIKGVWRGMDIYTLTLPERMTCPPDCYMISMCYGNAMHWTKRVEPGAVLENKLREEVADLAKKHPKGFVVRLHILGDFYSVPYVKVWEHLLGKHKELHVYGYTATASSAHDNKAEIARAIEMVAWKHPSRFAMRFSGPEPRPMGAVVIGRWPESSIVPEGVVCPAETDRTAACASCGLCWDPSMRDKSIVFIKHGKGSKKADSIIRDASQTDERGFRQIAPIKHLVKLARKPANEAPVMRWIDPAELWVDEAWQRNLNRTGLKLMSKMLQGWSWRFFKPPVCAEDKERGFLWVIDGQHTAIAAATHPEIDQIPVMVVDAETVSERAQAFIAHNKDRIAVTPIQLHYSSIRAGDEAAIAIDRACAATGVKIMRNMPPQGYEAGQTTAIGAIQTALRQHGEGQLEIILRVLSGERPVRADQIKAVGKLLASPGHEQINRSALISAIESLPYEQAIREARDLSASGALKTWEALAAVYYQAMSVKQERKAA
jgi:hypothetical protein